MSQEEQLKKMRLDILGSPNDISKDEVFKSRLDDAETVALNTLYPFNKKIQSLPDEKRIKNWQTRCAISLYKAMQRVGIQSYAENGLSVSYLTSLLDSNFLSELIPKAGVPK